MADASFALDVRDGPSELSPSSVDMKESSVLSLSSLLLSLDSKSIFRHNFVLDSMVNSFLGEMIMLWFYQPISSVLSVVEQRFILVLVISPVTDRRDPNPNLTP